MMNHSHGNTELCFCAVVVLTGLRILFSFADSFFYFRSLKCGVSIDTKSRNNVAKIKQIDVMLKFFEFSRKRVQ